MPELEGKPWRDIYYESFDDLRLYARHYPASDERFRSVVCLPGLTRNSRDFHTLATYLSTHSEKPRNVYCLDYRGRGQSQYDSNWRNYVPYTELLDVLDFLTVQGLHRVGIVGTSRGGIIAMMMAALRPTAARSLRQATRVCMKSSCGTSQRQPDRLHGHIRARDQLPARSSACSASRPGTKASNAAQNWSRKASRSIINSCSAPAIST